MDFPFYNEKYGKQIAWLFNSDNNHLLGKPADLSVLDIRDFSLYVGTLYDFVVCAYYGMIKNEFYVNRIDKVFHLRIPYYEKCQIDPDHFYLQVHSGHRQIISVFIALNIMFLERKSIQINTDHLRTLLSQQIL